MNVRPETVSPLMQIPFSYPDKSVLLDVLLVESDINDALLAHGAEGQEVRWVNYTRLEEFESDRKSDKERLTVLNQCQGHCTTREKYTQNTTKELTQTRSQC